MHGAFHIDAFVVFFALSFVLTTVLRVLFNRAAKYVQHTIWMRRRAKGTLIKDTEADYWLKLINRPDYRPIWRWYYAEEWRKKHGQGGTVASNGKSKRRRISTRKLVYVSIALTIAVAAIFLVATIGPGNLGSWVPEIPVTTRIDVVDVWNATNIYATPTEMWYRASIWITPYVVFFLTLTRTDNAPSISGEKGVFFNLQSGYSSTLTGPGTGESVSYYVMMVTYVFQGGRAVNITAMPTGQYGLPMNLEPGESILFAVAIYLVNYANVSSGVDLATMKSTGGEMTILLKAPY